MRALIIGEAWGEREAKFKHAFVGPSGRELARMIGAAGLAPPLRVKHPDEKMMIDHWQWLRADHGIDTENVFNLHPPGNEIMNFFDRDGDKSLVRFKTGNRVGYILPQYRREVENLWDYIRTTKPNLVVAMGNSACWALVDKTGIGTIRGTIHHSDRLGLKVLPTYHPAAILRQWALRPVTLADLAKATRECEFPEIRRTERWISIPDPDESGLIQAAQWFNRAATKYAIDIETAFGQISMVSFARSKSDALVIQFHNPNGSSYWPTAELEVRAWKLVRRGLTAPIPKRFQNGIYDMGYFVRMGLVPVYGVPNNPGGDTMLRHHAMLPELPKALGFLGSLYANELSWKTMRTKNVDTIKRDE